MSELYVELIAPTFKQPKPKRNKGGDCFACTLKGVVDYVYPENNYSFDDIWDLFGDQYSSGGFVLRNTWDGMQRALDVLHNLGDPIEWEVVLPKQNEDLSNYAYNFYNSPVQDWYKSVVRYLEEGWLLLTDVDLDGRGARFEQDGKWYNNHNNHFLYIDGAKSQWSEYKTLECSDTRYKSMEDFVHVQCSAKGARWIKKEDIVDNYGAAALIKVKRKQQLSLFKDEPSLCVHKKFGMYNKEKE